MTAKELGNMPADRWETDELQLCKFKEIALHAVTNSCIYYDHEYQTCSPGGKCDKKCGRVNRFMNELEKLIKQKL